MWLRTSMMYVQQPRLQDLCFMLMDTDVSATGKIRYEREEERGYDC